MDSMQNNLEFTEDNQISRKWLNSSLYSAVDDLDLKTLSQSSTTSTCYKSDDSSKGLKQNDVTTTNISEIELLNKKLKETKDELYCKAMTVSELEKKVEELNQIISSNGISKSATQKIIELSRKNRDLHSELAKEKTRGRQLQKQILKLTEENAAYKTEISQSNNDDTVSKEQLLQDKVATLEEQLTISKRKAAEQSNHSQKLKQDLKLAQKVLVQEVGDNITISKMASSMESGWRGRAQQILSLQNKISELQQRISNGKQQQLRPPSLIASTTKQQRLDVDDKHKASVHKIEKENKQRYQDLKMELDKLQHDHETLKQQCSALRARNKTLTQESKERRKEAKEKSRNDISSRNDCTLTGYEDLERIITDLRVRLNKSEDERTKLNDTISRLQRKQKERDESGTTDGCGRVSLPPIKLNKSIRRQPPMITTRCSLSADQPSATATTQSRQFFGVDYEEVSAKNRVLEVERDRLVGLTDFLQTRLDEADDKIMKLQGELHIAQQTNRNKDNCMPKNNTKLQTQMDELSESLLLQKDENKVLRDNLLMVRQQRQQERKLYHSTLEETKQIFMETIRNIEIP